jgi:hypothetical protein
LSYFNVLIGKSLRSTGWLNRKSER